MSWKRERLIVSFQPSNRWLRRIKSDLPAVRSLGRLPLGFDSNDVIKAVLSLTSRDFYKSMTTYADHKVWQDVYKPVTSAGEVYLKLTVTDDVLVVSFKELGS